MAKSALIVGAGSGISASFARALARDGLAVLMISSDLPAILGMSDRIGVMRNGKLAQVGAPVDIYERPASRWVAGFVGDAGDGSG